MRRKAFQTETRNNLAYSRNRKNKKQTTMTRTKEWRFLQDYNIEVGMDQIMVRNINLLLSGEGIKESWAET